MDKDPRTYLLNKGRAQHFSILKQKNQGQIIDKGVRSQYDEYGKIRQSFNQTTVGFNRNNNKTIDACSSNKKPAIFDGLAPKSLEIGSLTQDTGRFAHFEKSGNKNKPETAMNMLRSSTTQNSQVKIDARSRSINVNEKLGKNNKSENATKRHADNIDSILKTDRRKT